MQGIIFIIRYPKKWYFKSDLILFRCSKLKVLHQNQQNLWVHMGTAVFVTRCYPWPLLRHGVRILHLHNVFSILPYLPNFHFLPSPTEPHFYSILLWCKFTVLYLLAYMLYYVLSKTLFKQNKTYSPISFSPTQTMPDHSDDGF